MNQTTREKIALVVFLFLVVLTVFGGITYLNVGHNWNVAATSIDDATGSLDGYVAIVYDGVTVPSATEATSTKAPVTRTSVTKSYRDKKASVLSLNVIDYTNYADGMILKCGTHRVGVFSVSTRLTDAQLKAKIKYFKDHKVDYIICITANSSLVTGRIEGVDIAISLTKEAKLAVGTTVNGTYYVQSPCTGKIGALLISPQSVVSSKDIDKL